MDRIKIEELEVYAYHGVFESEKIKGQQFFINAVLYLDTRESGLKDDLTLSVHYGEVSHFMNSYMKNNTFSLIEAAAEHMAHDILLEFTGIREIELEIRKPEAPIGLPFKSVSVQIRRGWKKAYIAVGSNLGDKNTYVTNSITELSNQKNIRNVVVSDLVESNPYGPEKQDTFLNGVISLETLYYPEELLRFLQELEEGAKRVRTVKWGPRTLDLDILLYEDMVMSTDNLTIPHKDMHNRDFVLAPLAALEPYLIHPLYHKTIEQLYKELKDRYII